MQVEKLMTKDVHTCRPEDSLHTVAQVMWDNDCGFVPLIDGSGKLQGVITDRDICMAAWSKNARLSDVRADQAMAREVCSCRTSDTIDAAEKMMARKQVRRLPVLDDQAVVVGVLSLNDIACHAANGRAKSSEIGGKGLVETLRAICSHERGAQASAAA